MFAVHFVQSFDIFSNKLRELFNERQEGQPKRNKKVLLRLLLYSFFSDTTTH